MKKLYLVAASAALVACSESPTQPAIRPSLPATTTADLKVPKPGKELTCVQDGGGICTVFGKDFASATLDNRADGPYVDVAQVYSQVQLAAYGLLLSQVTDLGYHYTGSIAPQPGNLSFNIPIDTDGDGYYNDFAFVDAFHCPGNKGTVNVTKDASCVIYDQESNSYANWAAFVAAQPATARISLLDYYIFISAERTDGEPPALWTVDHAKFGKLAKL